MAKRFQPKIIQRKARFAVAGIQPAQMIALIAQPVRDDIEARILRAEDVRDSPAPPLMAHQRDITAKRNVITVNGQQLYQLPGKQYRGYPYYKGIKSPPAIRNWRYTGRTLRSMKVLSAAVNKATIGFTDARSNLIAAVNNRRWKQFGVSPRNRRVLMRAVAQARIVHVVKQAA